MATYVLVHGGHHGGWCYQKVTRLLRKAGHVTEYAILAWLAARAFTASSRELVRSRWFWLSLLVVIAYSLGDEFHQSFVPSRTGSIYDSLIDSLGGLTMLALLALGKRRGSETA